MIQANEIRLGNWVSHTNDNGTFNLQVEEIRPTGIITTWNGGSWFVSFDKIVAIPLTEEILLKAGFEKDTGEFYLYKDITVRKTYYSDDFWRFIFKQQRIKDIKYLHDLQNTIFALTGENPVLGLKILNDAIK
ncbi:hypothetical protein [Dysgonomonas capnocytophagoides]|uniref:hypothetical protein n=1 Tax=Dysgonomonas capnocytophagoides TaxID=45254 RepID=UPI00291F10AB|nr:hypothetical protein DCPSUM001_33170 [Dysgonomonas capnocytophagoides]